MADAGSNPDESARFARAMKHSMIFTDPPRHTKLRALVAKAFTSRAIEALRPRIADIARRLIHDLPRGETVNIVERFTAPLPIEVIAEMLGVPPDGSATTMNTGSPCWLVTQVSSVAGAGGLQPRDVHLLHGPGGVVGACMPVHVEEAQRLGTGRGVPAGQRHDQVRCLAGRGELAERAADRLDFRRPVQAQHRGRDPRGALGPGLVG
jgi:hypothetical protein